MVRTIELGSCVQVQGAFVRKGTMGRIVVRVGERLFEGFPLGANSSK